MSENNSTPALKSKYAALEESGNASDLGVFIVAAQAINLQVANRLNVKFGNLPQVFAGYQYDSVQQNIIETDNAVFQLGKTEYPVTTISATTTQPIFI